jgi:2-polyprenyl-3-methyl-5-hydroxy-6-metoxy-1,4-benzoquinol methylase
MQDAEFWNAQAAKYFRTPITDEAAYQEKLAITRRHLTADDRLLEVGCGTGGTAIALAPQVRQVVATDYSKRMIEFAWSRVDATRIQNVSFDVMALEDVRATQPFDAVMAMSLLHLVRDRCAALSTLRGLIKPGGYFISSTACIADRMAFMRPILPVMRLCGAAPWAAVFKEEQLRTEIEAAGFEIVQRFRPKRAMAVFFVARRSGSA